MAVGNRLNVVGDVGPVSEAQAGYFTRAQAAAAGVADFELNRAISYGQVERLEHGVYRVVGAGVDPHQSLRVLWLRLTPAVGPRERLRHPALWVSHQSAAQLLELGVFLPPVHEFISTYRRQVNVPAKIRTRSKGLARHEWVERDGFAVTSPVRTLTDLVAANHDGGHLGSYIADALRSGQATRTELVEALNGRHDLDALLDMASETVHG